MLYITKKIKKNELIVSHLSLEHILQVLGTGDAEVIFWYWACKLTATLVHFISLHVGDIE